jgi:hypothetical protein
MLYSVDTGKYVTKLPHKREFDSWMRSLSVADYQSIIDALSGRLIHRIFTRQVGYPVTIGPEPFISQYTTPAGKIKPRLACSLV